MSTSQKKEEVKPSQEYTAVDHSTLSKLLQTWWNFVARVMPNYISPNVITLSGCLGVLIPLSMCIYFNPNFNTPVPRYIGVLVSLGIFFFQTMDAVDGKQARKLQMFSPLGDFCDHLADTFSSPLMALCLCNLCSVDPLVTYYVVYGVRAINFTWLISTKYTKVAYHPEGFGITEGQCFSMLVGILYTIIGYYPMKVDLRPLVGLDPKTTIVPLINLSRILACVSLGQSVVWFLFNIYRIVFHSHNFSLKNFLLDILDSINVSLSLYFLMDNVLFQKSPLLVIETYHILFIQIMITVQVKKLYEMNAGTSIAFNNITTYLMIVPYVLWALVVKKFIPLKLPSFGLYAQNLFFYTVAVLFVNIGVQIYKMCSHMKIPFLGVIDRSKKTN